MTNRVLPNAALASNNSIIPFVQRRFIGSIQRITNESALHRHGNLQEEFNHTLPSLISSTPRDEDQDPSSIKDTYASALLSEVVYKGVDVGHEAAEGAAKRLKSILPVEVSLSELSWSPSRQFQKYVMSEGPDAIYVAFLGTKKPLDLLASLNMKTAHAFLPLGPRVAVHKGYLQRAAQIPSEEMYQLAAARGKRLVFTGHSMGGAIATICALHILSMLPTNLHSSVQAIGFATPPLGNAELESVVQSRGWTSQIKNILLPEDWVHGAMTLWRAQGRVQTTSMAATRATVDVQSTVLLDGEGRCAGAAGSAALSATIEVASPLEGDSRTISLGAADHPRSAQSTEISVNADWCLCWGHGKFRSEYQSFNQEMWNFTPFPSSWENNKTLCLASS